MDVESLELSQKKPYSHQDAETESASERSLHDDIPGVHQHMNWRLFVSLTAMSFLWVGSQIPLYLYGSILPLMFSDIGGATDGKYQWMVIGFLIPNAALCPFVGSLSDLFGRRVIAMIGQTLLVVGPVVVAVSRTINIAIGGMVIAGIGAGLNELVALSGTSELVPARKRGFYVGAVVFTILPFCASPLFAHLIARDSSWRRVGYLVSIWNFVGLVLVVLFYRDPARHAPRGSKMEIARGVDYIGGILSTTGVIGMMIGLQWSAHQYPWTSAHVLVPFFGGVALLIAFGIYEWKVALFPMIPSALFLRSKRTMALILTITFFSGANFFVILLIWPTQVYNMYGDDAIMAGVRNLPIGFGIIAGAVIALLLIGLTKGRTTALMLFFTACMTAATGCMAFATPTNLNSVVYPILTVAALSVGAVIFPCSLIAQIVCPVDLIGTITAITLSLRYIGGAIGFTIFYNVLFRKLYPHAELVPAELGREGVSKDPGVLYHLVLLGAQSQYTELRKYIANTPAVIRKDDAFDLVIQHLQYAFMYAYRWPYWISIAFGLVCVIAALGLRSVRAFL
ncbi:MFS general substrate transporter [Piedraia hortae CBS 480.64]|uniref:MFS general substrate transporter n=1 Tax=Piedraia hortae CBS 480.64 TaxID=1314780 RepID=A0A6A7C1L0_9PEZI|nr:MFS general substrate transporter [Piedraia hortae CBS 480.64]